MGVPVQGATGTSLAIVGLNAATGALDHLRRGRSLLRTGAAFGASGVFAALAGVWLNHRGVGFLTGFFGVGGGFLIVPALVLVLGLPMHLAVGTSLVAISLNALWGMIGNLQLGTLDWTLTLLFAAGGIVGLRWTTRFCMNAALASVRYWRTALSLVGDNPAIAEVAREAEARLRTALDSLHA